MISKAFNEPVPDGREHLNQQGLTERNPNVVNHKMAALEVSQGRVVHLSDGVCVLNQTVVKYRSGRHVESKPTLSCIVGSGFPR